MKDKLKIALINTSDLQGGAAIACYRLASALTIDKTLNVKMVVKEKTTNTDFVISANPTKFSQKKGKLNFALEKATFLQHERSKSMRFLFSNPNFGQDITQIPEVREADIIHLHWINKGYLSLRTLNKLKSLNKPLVWTLHDMWPFTGGCHYSGTCTNYTVNCGNCHFLKKPKPNDLSRKIWNTKEKMFDNTNMHIVTCSKWLRDLARSSKLFSRKPVINIPNTIDLEVFKPEIKKELDRQNHTILFQAMNINDERKGLKYFLETLSILKEKSPEFSKNIRLLIFGKDVSHIANNIPFELDYLGILTSQEQIVAAYQQADVYVTPSLEDNLPNTIMESLACGVPVVGFETGGIPEMVDHKINGFIAPKKDAEKLAEGIKWVLEDKDRYRLLSDKAVAKAKFTYAHEIVGNQYKALYTSILSETRKSEWES